VVGDKHDRSMPMSGPERRSWLHRLPTESRLSTVHRYRFHWVRRISWDTRFPARSSSTRRPEVAAEGSAHPRLTIRLPDDQRRWWAVAACSAGRSPTGTIWSVEVSWRWASPWSSV